MSADSFDGYQTPEGIKRIKVDTGRWDFSSFYPHERTQYSWPEGDGAQRSAEQIEPYLTREEEDGLFDACGTRINIIAPLQMRTVFARKGRECPRAKRQQERLEALIDGRLGTVMRAYAQAEVYGDGGAKLIDEFVQGSCQRWRSRTRLLVLDAERSLYQILLGEGTLFNHVLAAGVLYTVGGREMGKELVRLELGDPDGRGPRHG